MISNIAPGAGECIRRTFGESTMLFYGKMLKSGSVILYGSSIALGFVLCKAWFIAQAVV
jgi:hypothetical protein